jgi:hypothetical protein
LAESFQLAPQVERQTAAARAEFQQVAAALGEDFRCLARQAASEERREFRRGDEIARRAQFRRARAVVAQAGRIERQFHETREGNPPRCRNLAPDMVCERFGMLPGGVGGGRKRCHLW